MSSVNSLKREIQVIQKAIQPQESSRHAEYLESLLTVNDAFIQFSRATTENDKIEKQDRIVESIRVHNAKFPKDRLYSVHEQRALEPYNHLFEETI